MLSNAHSRMLHVEVILEWAAHDVTMARFKAERSAPRQPITHETFPMLVNHRNVRQDLNSPLHSSMIHSLAKRNKFIHQLATDSRGVEKVQWKHSLLWLSRSWTSKFVWINRLAHACERWPELIGLGGFFVVYITSQLGKTFFSPHQLWHIKSWQVAIFCRMDFG